MKNKEKNLRRKRITKKKRDKPPSQEKANNTLERKKTKTECFKSEEEKIVVVYKDKEREISLETNSSTSFYNSLNSLVIIVAIYSSQNPWTVLIALSFYSLMFYFGNLHKLK